MARFPALFACCATAFASDTISVFGLTWDVPTAADWKVDGGELALTVPRPSTQPRRPTQYALARTAPLGKVTLEFEVKKELAEARNRHTSVMVVYGWRDKDHFNYAHLSVDAARTQPVHNGIFHVYGGDRVRISSEDGPATLSGERWQKVKLVYDASKGRAEVWVDGETSPSMRAVDLSLGSGRFGIGSFFDMGSFRNLRYSGE